MAVSITADRPSRWMRFVAVMGPGLVVMLADTDAGSVITAALSNLPMARCISSAPVMTGLLLPLYRYQQEAAVTAAITRNVGSATGSGRDENASSPASGRPINTS